MTFAVQCQNEMTGWPTVKMAFACMAAYLIGVHNNLWPGCTIEIYFTRLTSVVWISKLLDWAASWLITWVLFWDPLYSWHTEWCREPLWHKNSYEKQKLKVGQICNCFNSALEKSWICISLSVSGSWSKLNLWLHPAAEKNWDFRFVSGWVTWLASRSLG